MRRSARVVLSLAVMAVSGGISGSGMGGVSIASAQDGLSGAERELIEVTRNVIPAVVGIRTGSGSGSGVIIRPDGVIITNAHVVGNAGQVLVSLADGSELRGTVLGRDPTIDIAVVRVPASNLPVAPLADSDRVVVGQTAIAIGNPFGFERTVTTGIVSGLNRALDPRLPELIQTDAAINSGNSGGPLLNSSGQVIGINTVIIDPGIATGLGFAVPINLARDVVDQLLTTGVIRRAYLGIGSTSLTPEVAFQYRLPVQQGAIVTAVGAGTPAAQAGLLPGDIITRIDDTPVTAQGDLLRVLRQRRPGDTITITAVRAQQEREFTVQVRLAALEYQ